MGRLLYPLLIEKKSLEGTIFQHLNLIDADPVVSKEDALGFFEFDILPTLLKSRIILFNGIPDTTTSNEKYVEGEELRLRLTGLSLPFPSVYVEMTSEFNSDLFSLKGEYGQQVGVTSFLIEEVPPEPDGFWGFCYNLYFFMTSLHPSKGRVPLYAIYNGNKDVGFKDHKTNTILTPLMNGVCNYIEELNQRKTKVGEVKVNIKNRVPLNGRELHKVKKLIVVQPNTKQKAVYDTCMGYPVDWKHSWEVMGHWRKVPSIGKDRNGDYTVKGLTWVKPHTKGKGELVKKTRLFKNPINPS